VGPQAVGGDANGFKEIHAAGAGGGFAGGHECGGHQ
jgi:hypothetical protein